MSTPVKLIMSDLGKVQLGTSQHSFWTIKPLKGHPVLKDLSSNGTKSKLAAGAPEFRPVAGTCYRATWSLWVVAPSTGPSSDGSGGDPIECMNNEAGTRAMTIYRQYPQLQLP